jgi:hypothetical protein
VVIEPGLADRDHFRVPRARDQVRRRHVRFRLRIMRMGADGTENVGKTLGNRQHFRVTGNARRDRNQARNAGIARASDYGIELVGKIGKIEMAMAVDQHSYCAAPASAST